MKIKSFRKDFVNKIPNEKNHDQRYYIMWHTQTRKYTIYFISKEIKKNFHRDLRKVFLTYVSFKSNFPPPTLALVFFHFVRVKKTFPVTVCVCGFAMSGRRLHRS